MAPGGHGASLERRIKIPAAARMRIPPGTEPARGGAGRATGLPTPVAGLRLSTASRGTIQVQRSTRRTTLCDTRNRRTRTLELYTCVEHQMCMLTWCRRLYHAQSLQTRCTHPVSVCHTCSDPRQYNSYAALPHASDGWRMLLFRLASRTARSCG